MGAVSANEQRISLISGSAHVLPLIVLSMQVKNRACQNDSYVVNYLEKTPQVSREFVSAWERLYTPADMLCGHKSFARLRAVAIILDSLVC